MGAAEAAPGAPHLQLAAHRLLLLAGDPQAAQPRVGHLLPLQLDGLAQLQAQVPCAAQAQGFRDGIMA